MLAFTALFCCGCPQYADPMVPEPILRVTEPNTNGDYLMYTPSRHNIEEPTPLVILCHGTKPWDSPIREIRDWVKLAEEKNFVVAAPHLKGTRGDFPPPPHKQIPLQQKDEKKILSVVQHISGSRNIDENRIFLAGWSAGGYAVLHTGLKHPEVFRALAVLQGNFDTAFMADAVEHIDPYQPIYILRGTTDVLTGKQGKVCADWLYEQNAYVFDSDIPGPHRGHPKSAYEFFERVVREIPLMRIVATTDTAESLRTLSFDISGSFKPERFEWSFGDGETSPVARPVHTYKADGEYKITLTALDDSGKRIRRSTRIRIPQPTFKHHLLN